MATKVIKLVCAACGYAPEWTRADWGRHPETHGHGPDPICTNLVEDHRFRMENGDPCFMRCGGTLVPAGAVGARKGD